MVSRQLWQDATERRRMIAIGASSKGDPFIVMTDKYDLEYMHKATELRDRPAFTAETSRNKALYVMPHYTDRRFDKEQTVFGREAKGLHYDYSDRIVQWDGDKADAAFEAAKASGKVQRSAEFYDVYLSEYFGKPTRVEHVIAGVNRSNGYPYHVFGYRFTEESE